MSLPGSEAPLTLIGASNNFAKLWKMIWWNLFWPHFCGVIWWSFFRRPWLCFMLLNETAIKSALKLQNSYDSKSTYWPCQWTSPHCFLFNLMEIALRRKLFCHALRHLNLFPLTCTTRDICSQKPQHLVQRKQIRAPCWDENNHFSTGSGARTWQNTILMQVEIQLKGLLAPSWWILSYCCL